MQINSGQWTVDLAFYFMTQFRFRWIYANAFDFHFSEFSDNFGECGNNGSSLKHDHRHMYDSLI